MENDGNYSCLSDSLLPRPVIQMGHKEDGTTIDYLYEGQTAPNTAGATSRLQSSTDAKSQRTNYSYFADDTVHQITYTNTAGQPLTPPTPVHDEIYAELLPLERKTRGAEMTKHE
jgi:hypothetical protein